MKYRRVKKEVDSVVSTIENWIHNAIFMAMVKVVLPRFEMIVRLITGSSTLEPNSVVQNSVQRIFLGNMDNTPLKTASGRTDLIIN